VHIGILTRNQQANAHAIATKHNLHFDAVIGREDGPAKPDAFGVLELCRQFGVKPQETMLVGDYLFDLLCAKSAGAYAVLLANHHQADNFAEHADFCIENISGILDIIANKNSEKRVKE
jgi:phosphoglycolate phosphatase-like HAD superfamily hydrolase